MLIDTHCHLDDEKFASDLEAVITRAKKENIKYFINAATNLSSCKKAVNLAQKYPQIFAALGVHPNYSKFTTDEELDEIYRMFGADKIIAVGEIGLDYFRDFSPKEKQQSVFEYFLKLAIKLKLPVIVHNRNADRDVIRILKKHNAKIKKVIMHCFQGDREFLNTCLDLGFFISFAGNITFKNAHTLRDVAKFTPIERIIVETDAPYLAPESFRSKRNEPAFLKYAAEEIARIKGLSFADVSRITSHNACNIFNIRTEENTGKIAYAIRDSLYLNITNKCMNKCSFCIRNSTYFVKGHNLKLDHEPKLEEIIEAIASPSQFKEVVFCGIGEPLLRMDIVLELAKFLKENYKIKIRLNTNGTGNIIHKRDVTKELCAVIDEVSVSLNAHDKPTYNLLCRPQLGMDTFDKIIEFIASCRKNIKNVSVTVIDLPEVNLDKCRAIASSLGVKLRIRHYDEVG